MDPLSSGLAILNVLAIIGGGIALWNRTHNLLMILQGDISDLKNDVEKLEQRLESIRFGRR